MAAGMLLLAALLPAGGCDLFNPCITLAERICQCEATPSARESCRQQRIEALRNSVEVTPAQWDRCEIALTTCDCNDIDENRVDECAFTAE